MAPTGMDVAGWVGVVGDLAGWAEQARWSAAAFTAAAGAADGGRGNDPAGTVTAVVGPDGRLCGVAVADEWARALGPDALGPAVVAAVVDATRDRLGRWTGALSRTDPAALTAPPAPVITPPGDLTTPRAAQSSVAALADLVLRALDEGRSGPDAAVVPAVGVARLRGGEVRVTVDGGHVVEVDVEFEPYPGHAAPLAAAILAAAGDAYRRWDTRAAGPGPAGRELLARVADPAALLASLGLAGVAR